MPLPEGGRPEHQSYQEPPLSIYLRANGLDIEGVITLLAVRARRVYGVYKNSGSSSRTKFYLDTCLPASFHLSTPEFEGLVSLRIAMPTKLSTRLLCVEPEAPAPIQGHYLRDRARGRGRQWTIKLKNPDFQAQFLLVDPILLIPHLYRQRKLLRSSLHSYDVCPDLYFMSSVCFKLRISSHIWFSFVLFNKGVNRKYSSRLLNWLSFRKF